MTSGVTSVKVLNNFWIEAEFADGQVRRFDMQSYLAYPAFAPLKECGLFKRAHVAHGVVVWTDEIDLSLNTLYLLGESVERVFP